ncbi:MAG: serine/threonine-protein kinase [Nannocystaceae bacterium]
MSESLAETQAGRPASSQADLGAVSLAQTMDASRPGLRTGVEKVRSGESLARTMIAAGELTDDGASPAKKEPVLIETRIAGEAPEAPSLRSRSGDRVEVGLARTMDLSDPAAQRSASDAMDADLIGLARTQIKSDIDDLSAPSRPSLRRDDAITDEPDLERRVLAADPDDRRLKELIRARLFRKRATPVKIGRFTILDRLGEGGMGVVYTAYDDQLDRKVAIKVMRSEGNEGTLGSARLRREAQAMARLSHPNIVTVHEVNEYEDQIYVAMEYIRGKSLDRWLQEPHPWQEVVDVFRQAGLGLEAAHQAGLVHRDFKPHNVLLGEDGVAKVLDFGLVRSAGAPEIAPAAGAMVPTESQALSLLDASLTRTGAIMGTPAYMAPEQHMGLVATPQSDLFSFCVALYEGLYGDHPYDCTTLTNLIGAVTSGRIKESPSSTKVPTWLRKVVLRGLAVKPAQRYTSMRELLVELSRDPVARRRRIFGSAGAALVVGAIGFGAATYGAPAVAACTGADQEITAAWDDAKKESVKAALLGTGVAYAGETWEKIGPRLDAYASEWSAMRTEACESHRDHKHSDRLFDLRTACLDQRRAGFVGLVEVLGSADAGVVENAVKAVGSLPPLATCADTEALTSAVPPPEDPAVAARVQALREDLARIKVDEDTGRYAVGLTAIAPQVEEARALGYAPLIGEALLRQGSLEMASGMAKEAEASLSAALTTSFTAGDDGHALEALSKRIFAVTILAGDPRRALADAPWGEALIARSAATPEQRALFLDNVGAARLETGDLERGEALRREALDLRREALGPTSLEVAVSMANLGDYYNGAGDSQRAIEMLEAARSIASEELGARHPVTGNCALSLGLAYLGAGRLSDADRAMQAGFEVIREAFDPSSPMVAVGSLIVAAKDVERRDLAAAIPRLERTLELATAAAGPSAALVGVVTQWMATARAAGGELSAARTLHERSLEVLRGAEVADPMLLADALDAYGDTLRRDGEREAALARYEEALRVREDKLTPGTASLAITLEHLGATLTELGRLDEAAKALGEASEVVAKALPAGSQQAAKILRSESALALARGDAATATAKARAALTIHEARDAGDGELALTRLALARALRAAGEAREAETLGRAAAQALTAAGPGWQREAADADRFVAGE